MTRDQLLAAFDKIRVWQQGDRRAVHKPLLVLLMLARLARNEPPRVEFAAIEPQLKSLLEEFGPSGSEASRHYPFWHLKTDGLWALNGPDAIVNRAPAATPTLTELRNQHVQGGFADGVRAAFASDPALIIEVATRILRDHFPDTIRQDVADAVGLDLDAASGSATQTPDQEETRRRDPHLRCNKSLPPHISRSRDQFLPMRVSRSDDQSLPLRSGGRLGGGQTISHGAWCLIASLHHKIFDLGAFTVLPQNYQIVFSRHAIGGDATRAKLLAHHGAALIPPQSREYLPSAEFLDWHRKQVFKEPGRE